MFLKIYLLTVQFYLQMPEAKKLSFVENFVLSGAAAVISKTGAAPIERIKLLVQNQDEMIKQGKLAEPYKGVIDCTLKTFRSEGLFIFISFLFLTLLQPNIVSYFNCFL